MGQFAVVLPAKDKRPVLLAKRFPMPTEESFLHLPADAPEPVISTPGGVAAVLVCHDVNVYHPRGVATTTSEERHDWRTTLREEIEGSEPWLGLHLSHYVETVKTFSTPYHEWAKELGIPLVGVSGLPVDISQDESKVLASSLLSGTETLPLLTLCEQPS